MSDSGAMDDTLAIIIAAILALGLAAHDLWAYWQRRRKRRVRKKKKTVKCSHCDGTGEVLILDAPPFRDLFECDYCGGTGIEGNDGNVPLGCRYCLGDGYVWRRSKQAE